VKSLSEEILPSQPIKIFKFKFFLGNFEASWSVKIDVYKFFK
jgi:hypothetical protein